MAAEVDYTALEGLGDTGAAATKALKTGFPLSGPPAQALKQEGWIKLSLDFAKTNLAAADWAKIFDIPDRMYIFDILTNIKKIEGQDSVITIGDASADGSVTWVAAQTGQVVDVTHRTLVADANGATRGKFYATGGGLYISSTSILDTLKIDIYVHFMMIDPIA